jgi:cation:H+ antiporter
MVQCWTIRLLTAKGGMAQRLGGRATAPDRAGGAGLAGGAAGRQSDNSTAMSPIIGALAALAAGGVAVVLAGVVLARSCDVIAARTRLGRVWVGSIFLAAATSLPELTTDIAAVRIGAADLAAGDLFGSSMANMLILAGIALRPGEELFRRAALDHALSAALAIVLNAIAAVAILLAPQATVLGLGPGSLLLLIAYLAGTRVLFRHSTVAREAGVAIELGGLEAAPPQGGEAELPSLGGAVVRFLLASAVILVAAPVFASAAVRLAELTGIATSFIGTWLVGMTTSLPELVTCIAAVRMGALDLAVGNLLGSNAFNMVIFVPLDLAQPGEPMLAAVSAVHAVTALVAIIMMAVALGAVVYRSKVPGARLEPISVLMIGVYVTGLLIVYGQGG